MDYLTTPLLRQVEGIVTNPPYAKALQFLKKALTEVPYVALLLRTNFLMDSERRGRWLDQHEPARVYLFQPRLPMMHRYGWTGKRSSSNTPHAWCIWQRDTPREFPKRVYWRELLGVEPPAKLRAHEVAMCRRPYRRFLAIFSADRADRIESSDAPMSKWVMSSAARSAAIMASFSLAPFRGSRSAA